MLYVYIGIVFGILSTICTFGLWYADALERHAPIIWVNSIPSILLGFVVGLILWPLCLILLAWLVYLLLSAALEMSRLRRV